MKGARSFALFVLAGVLPVLSGCLYSHTTRPLTTNLQATPVVDARASGDVRQIEYYVRVVWNANAIGEIARRHGFDEVYYADLETLRILGFWTQRWVHVYGRKTVAASGSG